MTLPKAKWLLAGIWLAGAGVVFTILVGQSLTGVYGGRVDDAWGWYLPTVMPTLSLILGVLASDARPGATAPATAAAAGPAPAALLWLGVALSGFYLLLVAVSILAQPLLQQTDPLELMQRSNLWLGPLQGLTAGVLAAFFRSS